MDKGERDWRRYRRAWRIGRIGTAFNAALAVFCAADTGTPLTEPVQGPHPEES